MPSATLKSGSHNVGSDSASLIMAMMQPLLGSQLSCLEMMFVRIPPRVLLTFSTKTHTRLASTFRMSNLVCNEDSTSCHVIINQW